MRTKERITVSVARWKRLLVALVVALVALFPTPAESDLFTPDATPPMPTGRVIGRIELVPGVPMRVCNVLFAGLPLGTKCDSEGRFEIGGVPFGRRDIYVTGEWIDGKKSQQFPVGVSKDAITTVTLVVSHYGAIIGQVVYADPKHLAEMYVTIEDFGIVAKPDANGYYVLDRVPPGDWRISLHNVWYIPSQTYERRVIVQPKKITQKVNFIMTPPVHAVAPTAPDSPTAKVDPPSSRVPLASTGRKVAPTAKMVPITIYNVSGQWKSNINLIYNITQQQNNFQWTVTNSTEKGKGTLSGYDISASWQGPQGGGSTQGKITEVDAQGKATKIIWNNGVKFYR